MKKLMLIVAAVAMVFVSGCKNPPTTDMMYAASKSIGGTVATILNFTSIDSQSRQIICDIVNEVIQCVPAVGETFESRWTPIAETHVKLLVDGGKITQVQADLILTAFKTVVKGIDYVFVKYPKAKNVQELVSAAVDGFGTGFLAVFKPDNDECTDCCIDCGERRDGELFNVEAYKYLTSRK